MYYEIVCMWYVSKCKCNILCTYMYVNKRIELAQRGIALYNIYVLLLLRYYIDIIFTLHIQRIYFTDIIFTLHMQRTYCTDIIFTLHMKRSYFADIITTLHMQRIYCTDVIFTLHTKRTYCTDVIFTLHITATHPVIRSVYRWQVSLSAEGLCLKYYPLEPSYSASLVTFRCFLCTVCGRELISHYCSISQTAPPT